MDVDLAAVEVGIEDGDAVGGPSAVFEFGCAGQEHDLVGHLRRRGPDLLTMDHIAARHLFSKGGDAGGVQARIRLGKAKTALILTGNQARHPAALLLMGALDHDGVGAKEVDMDRGGRGHAAAMAGHLMHHDRRFGHAQTRAAIGFRHGDAEPACIGHGAVKLTGKDPVLIARQPIVIAKPAHDRAHPFADSLAFFGGGKGFGGGHGRTLWVQMAYVRPVGQTCQMGIAWPGLLDLSLSNGLPI